MRDDLYPGERRRRPSRSPRPTVDPVVHASTHAVVGWHAHARPIAPLDTVLASALRATVALAERIGASESSIGAATRRYVFLRVDAGALSREVFEAIRGSFRASGIGLDRVVVLVAPRAGDAAIDLSACCRASYGLGLHLGLVLDEACVAESWRAVDGTFSHVVLPARALLWPTERPREAYRYIREIALSNDAELVVDGVATAGQIEDLKRMHVQLMIDPKHGRSDQGALDVARTSTAAPRYPVPADELARLRLVYDSRVLDTSAEQLFDDLAARAAEVAKTPMRAVSIVDVARQWFKSSVGLVTGESTTRSDAFCAHTVCSSTPLLVGDALTDLRFATNPLVQGPPWIRSYAGLPIVSSSGSSYGAVFAADVVRRDFRSDEVDELALLAHRVADELDRRVRAVRSAVRLGPEPVCVDDDVDGMG